MKQTLILLSVVLLMCGCAATEENYDICIYGGTSAGTIAAYSAAMLGKKVVVAEPGNHLGGLTTGGLGQTDIGNKQVVKGLSKQFYRKVGQHYGKLEQWIFEPRVADSIMRSYLNHENITVMTGTVLKSAERQGKTIKSVLLKRNGSGNLRISAKQFIDATYEGDLLAAAGVSYTVGRESNEVYGETWNGVQMLHLHQFPDGVDPYKMKGDPSSGLLWGISDAALAPAGSGDKLVQAYNYRMCLTSDPDNMIPITKPGNYDPERYELLLRLIEAQPDKTKVAGNYFIWSPMPNNKTDINNRGAFSSDMIGMNYDWPEASHKERQRIRQAHTDYTKGLLYFWGHDERVPAEMRQQMLRWGYPKDEYVDNGNWTPQLYVREGRRMVGDYVATQADCEGRRVPEDGVGMAAYTMDSHNCQRVVIEKDGVAMVKNEGDVQIHFGGAPYPVSYRSIVPKRSECGNLLVPVCLSSSHIAFGSIRMEPVFMVLGQVSAIAACMAIDSELDMVQDVDYREINSKIESDPCLDGSTPDILVDDTDAAVELTGDWSRIHKGGGYGRSFFELQPSAQTGKVLFPFTIEASGTYKVYSYQHLNNKKLAPETDFEIIVGGEVFRTSLDSSELFASGQTGSAWVLLGQYEFGEGQQGTVGIMSRRNAPGPTRADAVLLVKE